LNPSNIPVTGIDSLAQNFAQNSERFLCDLALGTGSYAIGARVLGLAKFTPQTALVTTGALMTALALCPSGANQQAIIGIPPTFTGGQCPVDYRIFARLGSFTEASCAVSVGAESPVGVGRGPISLRKTPSGQVISLPSCNIFNVALISTDVMANGIVVAGAGNQLDLPGSGYVITRVERIDGLPDNCGDAPREGGQLHSTADGDTFIDNSVVDNSNNFRLVPVTVNMGGINTTLTLKFGDLRIGSLLPFTYVINIGGTDFGFRRNPDGTSDPVPTSPDPEADKDGLKTLLRQIKDCVCDSPVELEALQLPLVRSSVSCDVTLQNFLVPKDSVGQSIVQDFQDSAQLATVACSEVVPVQLEESLIYAATTTQDGRELFSGLIDTDVVSLRIKITDIQNPTLKILTLYPEAKQRKFGSISFVTESVNGGGDYVYVFDTDTYLPLPTRGKKGKLRLLLKGGISFEVYDTGERI
jgi:hypothetical protein